MKLDNVWNSADPKAQIHFNSLKPISSSFKQMTEHVKAEHQITDIRLVSLYGDQRRRNYGLHAQGLRIYSQLTGIYFFPDQPTNVVDHNGNKANPDDPKRKYDESALYILSKADLKNAENSGAYDNPSYWERALNQELDGVAYSRDTEIDMDVLHIKQTPIASLSHFQGRQKVNTITRALVNTADSPVLWNGTSSCDFGWFFSQALDEMKTDYEQNGDGFRIDKYLAERYQEENEVDEKQERATISSLKTSPDMHLASDNQVKKSAGPVSRTATGAVKIPAPEAETSEQATKEHISNQKNATPNELNVRDNQSSKPSSISEESAKESQTEQQPISPNPNAVNNEMDMDSPIRNGHAPLVSEDKDARRKKIQERRIRQEQQNRNDLDFGE